MLGLKIGFKIALVSMAVLGLGAVGVLAATSSHVNSVESAASQSTSAVQLSHNGNIRNSGIVTAQKHIEVGNDISSTLTNTDTLNGKGENKIALVIATTFSVPVTSVIQLRNQDWGFGEIYRLYDLSKLSGQTPDQIQALRDSGMGWGQIAHMLGVKPGHGGDNLGSIVSGNASTTGGGKGKSQNLHGNSDNTQRGSNGNGDQNNKHGKP